MTKYIVDVVRSVTTRVEVEAEDAEAAARKVGDHSVELHPIEEWGSLDDWKLSVYDEAGSEVLRVD